MKNIWRTGLFALIICGIVFATTSGIIPIKTDITLTDTQTATLTAKGVTTIKAGAMICEEKECTLKRFAYCETSIKTNTGEPLPTIILPTCKCESVARNKNNFAIECVKWHYFTPEELAEQQLEKIGKAMASYANKLAKPIEKPKNVEVVVASDYNIKAGK